MQSVDTKLIGYGLLITGLVIIALTGFNLYSILQGNTRAFNYFNFPPIELSTESLIGADLSTQERELVKQQSGGEFPKMEIASAELLNETSNLLAHLFIIGTIITLGARISSIGVQMIRPVKVVVSQSKLNNAQVPQK